MKNNDTERTVDPKTLENGNVLRMLVMQFVNKPCRQYYIAVLRCLRDSFIVIPGNVEISDADAKAILNVKECDTLTSQEQMKFVPDILRNGDEFFLPVFSSADQIGEYGKGFSTMEMHFFDAMRYANGKEKVCDIVLDAFTHPYSFWATNIKGYAVLFLFHHWIFPVISSFLSNIVEEPLFCTPQLFKYY